MIGVFIVFVSIISADMAGDEILRMIDTDAIGVDSQAEFGAGIGVWNGIGVGVDFDAELRGGPELNGSGDIVRVGCQGQEHGFFLIKHLGRFPAGFPVDANVGDGVTPVPGGGTHGVEVGQVESGCFHTNPR
jgi:hypothetical protein